MKKLMLASALFCSTVLAISGCQSTSKNTVSVAYSTTQPYTLDIPKNQVMQWSSGYNWQLSEVTRDDGQLIPIQSTNPIRLAIDPGRLHFYQGCTHDKIDLFSGAPPFSYSSYIVQLPATCTNSSTDDYNIRTLFEDYGTYMFGIKLLPTTSLTAQDDTIASPKRLALTMENGNQLIFTGMAKPLLSSPIGLPISTKLLANYKWHLESAVANHYDEQGKLMNREPISDFYHPDYPISFEIFSQSENSIISFGSNCNGSGAPYFLLDDNTLKVGMIISTMMGCGETGNRIETTLFNFMQESSSTLTLSMQLQSATGNTGDYPRYNLLQTMATGETLIWKNEPKKIP